MCVIALCVSALVQPSLVSDWDRLHGAMSRTEMESDSVFYSAHSGHDNATPASLSQCLHHICKRARLSACAPPMGAAVASSAGRPALLASTSCFQKRRTTPNQALATGYKTQSHIIAGGCGCRWSTLALRPFGIPWAASCNAVASGSAVSAECAGEHPRRCR